MDFADIVLTLLALLVLAVYTRFVIWVHNLWLSLNKQQRVSTSDAWVQSQTTYTRRNAHPRFVVLNN